MVFRQNLFKNSVFLVPGGAGGMGRQVAIDLLSLGASVMISSRHQDRLSTAFEYILEKISPVEYKNDAKKRLQGFVGNVKKESDCKLMVENTTEHFGPINGLVNFAGGQFVSRSERLNEKTWKAVVDANLTGSFLLANAVYHSNMKETGGVIINITSSDMLVGAGLAGMAHSSAARAGVQNLTNHLAVEWAPKVRVNNVAPGIIYTDRAASNYPMPIFEHLEPIVPLGRLGVPTDISKIVCFLLSPAAEFITGATIAVDGGSSANTVAYQAGARLFDKMDKFKSSDKGKPE